MMDVVVGSVIALAVLPIIGVLALVGLAVFRSNPFFVQERVGLHGTDFRLWKLRSMPPQAPAYADKYQLQKVQIPRWGRFIRKLHLDELPQLFHVPTGRMSLVGPRPEMRFLHEQMPAMFARRRVAVRPGCTGLWQISVASERLILETPEYDDFYLANRTWRMDAWLVVRTVMMMVQLGRPVSLERIPRWVVPEAARTQWQPSVAPLRDTA